MLLWKILRANRMSVGFILFFLFLQLLLFLLVGSASFKYDEIILGFTWWQWAGFYAIAALLMAISLMATTFVSFLSGYFLGFASLPFIVVAYLLASVAGYFIARRIDNGVFLKSISGEKEVVEVLDNLRESHLSMIILARMSPILPFSVMNILLYIAGVDFRRFVIGGLIGMFPRALVTVWIGWQARQVHLFSEQNSVETYLKIGLIVISIGGLFYLFNRALRRKATGKK